MISKALRAHHEGNVKLWPEKLKVDHINNVAKKLEKRLKADEDDAEEDENEIIVPAHPKEKEENEKAKEEEEEDEDDGDDIGMQFSLKLTNYSDKKK